MKRLFFLVLLFAFAIPAQAQYSTTIYTDTTLATSTAASAAAQVAITARGYTNFVELRSDANDFIVRYLQFHFRGQTARQAAAAAFTTDSVKVQGLFVKKTAANVLDTIWQDIPLTYQITSASSPTDAGWGDQRDTTCTWIAVGQTGITHLENYISPQFKLPAIYHDYRVVSGKHDSGRVVIKEIWEKVR